MKVFAILTAALMVAGGSAYYFGAFESSSPSPCCKLKTAPVAKTGGCCSDSQNPACCANGGTPDCCGPNEPCCLTGVECCISGACCEPATATTAAKADCCAVGADCCFPGSACCSAPAAVAVRAKAAPVEEACCPHCLTPAKVATAAVVAGVTPK